MGPQNTSQSSHSTNKCPRAPAGGGLTAASGSLFCSSVTTLEPSWKQEQMCCSPSSIHPKVTLVSCGTSVSLFVNLESEAKNVLWCLWGRSALQCDYSPAFGLLMKCKFKYDLELLSLPLECCALLHSLSVLGIEPRFFCMVGKHPTC